MALGIGSGLHSGFFGEEENRWMKRVFASDQSNYCIPMFVTSFGDGWTGASDDIYTIKYDLYLVGPGYGGTNDSTSDNVSVQMKADNNTNAVTVSVPLNTVISMVQGPYTGNIDSNCNIMQITSNASLPDAGDIFYVRDITIEVKAADGSLKLFREWNFEEGGATLSTDGVATITSSQMDGAFSSQLFGQNPLA